MTGAGAGAGNIRGWGCTPTGDLPAAAVPCEERTKSTCLPSIRRGWRRTLLYCILMFLMIIVFLNLTLTLWIVSVLQLSVSGMGPIKIVRGGIQVTGQAWLLDNLVASSISAQPAQPITLHSFRNFSVVVTEPDRKDYAKLLLKRDRLECSGQSFRIQDAKGGDVFHASRDEVRISSETLAVDGAGGLVVKSAAQAPRLRAPPGSDLTLESSTRSLELRAPQSVYLESRAGSIDVTSLGDIKLHSEAGGINIEAANIMLPYLKEANTTDKALPKSAKIRVFQLCACASGKLFLAAPDAQCEAREGDTELCR